MSVYLSERNPDTKLKRYMHPYFLFFFIIVCIFNILYIQTRQSHLIKLSVNLTLFKNFLNIFYWLCYYNYSIFPSLFPSTLHTLSTRIPPFQFMSMGCTNKFFGVYISYTILNLPLSMFYLPFMLFILCEFSPSLPLPLPCW